MTYSISSISNRDLQLLYHYRILRQPASFLNAIYNQGESVLVTFSPVGESDEGYRFEVRTSIPSNKVPLLEFEGDEQYWDQLSFLKTLEVKTDRLVLTSDNSTLDGIQVRIFWVDSIEQFQNLLKGYEAELKALADDLDALKDKLSSLSDTEGFLKLLDGVDGNLVKIADTGAGLGLADANYHIVGPTTKTKLNNPSEKELANLIPDIDSDLTLVVQDPRPRTLQGLYGRGTITITGTGVWYLINITNDVSFEDFKGTVYLYNCPAVRITSGTTVSDLTVVNSFCAFSKGLIEKATLVRNSTLKHNSGKIVTLVHVGVGCEYYSQVSSGVAKTNQPTFEWSVIQGKVCLANGLIIMNGRDISFVTGHHDDPLQPSKLTVQTVGGV